MDVSDMFVVTLLYVAEIQPTTVMSDDNCDE